MTKLWRRAPRHGSTGVSLPQVAQIRGLMSLLGPVEPGSRSKGSSKGPSKGRPSRRRCPEGGTVVIRVLDGGLIGGTGRRPANWPAIGEGMGR